MSELTDFESHMDRMERERQAQQAALEVEKERTKQAKYSARGDTKEMLMFIVIALIAAAAIVGLVYIIWQASAGPSSKQQLEDKWRTDCNANHGTWIPGSSDSKAMCVNPSGEISTH
jgi:hypothetical protein